MFSKLFVAIVGLLPQGLIKRIGMIQAKSPMLHNFVVACRKLVQKQDMTIQQGLGAGQKFQPGESNFGYVTGTSEPDTQNTMKARIKPGDCFWDIGCNVGFLTVIGARLVGEAGQVYAFDPVPRHAELARHNVESNGLSQVKVFQKALAAANGTVKFAVAAIPAQSTLTADGFAREGATVIEVETVTVDGLIRDQGMRSPAVVKIDVEGAEMDVLRGMAKTLAEHRPIILLDTHGTHIECAALLTEAGYFCSTTADPEKPLQPSQYFCQLLAVPCGQHAAEHGAAGSVHAA
jgi:FkbM family methyltransferase